MQEIAASEIPVGRGSLIVGAVVVAALLLGMLYFIEQKYGIVWQELVWSIAFATLMFVRFFLEYRDKPVTRSAERPGLLVLNTLVFTFVLVFLGSSAQLTFDAVFAGLWPLLLGATLSLLAALLYSAFFREAR